MNRLNEYFMEAEKGSCSTYCEGCLACITAYLVYMCSETHYEKVCKIINVLKIIKPKYLFAGAA